MAISGFIKYLGKIGAGTSLAITLAGCGAMEEEIRREDAERLAKNMEIISTFNDAKTLTGVVFNAMYTPGGDYGNEREGRATLLVTLDNNPHEIFRFDYREERQFVCPVWDDWDIGVKEIVLYNKVGTKITWKEGFRPYDLPVEHVHSYRDGQPLVRVWPCARFK